MDPTASPATDTETEVGRLRRLQKDGHHAEALSGAEAMLRALPENRDLLLIAAISQRYLLRIDDALATLERLEALQPRFSRMHEERGLCFVARKDAPPAIDALLRAVNINPALPVSWRMLEGLYRLTKEPGNAATAAAHVATLKNLPHDVVTATSLFSDGDLVPAEQIVRAYLLRHGDHPEAMRLLARIGLARDVLDDAELLLEAVLELTPGLPGSPLRLRPDAGETSEVRPGPRAASINCWRWSPAISTTGRWWPPARWVSARTRRRSASTTRCWPMRQPHRTFTYGWPTR